MWLPGWQLAVGVDPFVARLSAFEDRLSAFVRVLSLVLSCSVSLLVSAV